MFRVLCTFLLKKIHVHGFDHKAPLMLRELLKRLLELKPHLKEGARGYVNSLDTAVQHSRVVHLFIALLLCTLKVNPASACEVLLDKRTN